MTEEQTDYIVDIEDVLPKPDTADSLGRVFPVAVVDSMREKLKETYPDGKIVVPHPGIEEVELVVYYYKESAGPGIPNESGQAIVAGMRYYAVRVPQMGLNFDDCGDREHISERVQKVVQEMADRAQGAIYVDSPDFGPESEEEGQFTITVKARRDVIHKTKTVGVGTISASTDVKSPGVDESGS
jgi:hypothetical protein